MIFSDDPLLISVVVVKGLVRVKIVGMKLVRDGFVVFMFWRMPDIARRAGRRC